MKITINTINEYLESLDLSKNNHYLVFLKKAQAILSRPVLRKLFEALIKKEININSFFDEENNFINPALGFNDDGISQRIDELKGSTTEYQYRFNRVKEVIEKTIENYTASLEFNPKLFYLYAKEFNSTGEGLEDKNNLISYNTEYFKILNARIDSMLIPIGEDENAIDYSKFWYYSEISGLFSKYLLNSRLSYKIEADCEEGKGFIIQSPTEYTPGTTYYIMDPNTSEDEHKVYIPTNFFKHDISELFTFRLPESDECGTHVEVYPSNNGIFNDISTINNSERQEIIKNIKRHIEVSNILTHSIFSPVDENSNDILGIGKSLHNTNNYTFFLDFSSTKFPDTAVDFPDIKKLYYGLHEMNKVQIFDKAIKYICDNIASGNDIITESTTNEEILTYVNTEISEIFGRIRTYAQYLNTSRVYTKENYYVVWSWKPYEGNIFRGNEFLQWLAAVNCELITSEIKSDWTYYNGITVEYEEEGVRKKKFTDEVNEAMKLFGDFPTDFFDFLGFIMALGYYIPIIINNGSTDTIEFTWEQYKIIRDELDEMKRCIIEKVNLQKELVNTNYRFITNSRRVGD